MTNFIQNTILTKYGLNRLNEFLYNYSLIYDETNKLVPNEIELPRFNFTQVVIGNMYGGLNIETTELTNEVFSLPVESVEQDKNIFTIHSTITADIIDLKLSQIGVYETVNGENHLFAYGDIDSYKPDTNYELIVNLEINIEELQFYKDKLNVLIVRPDTIPIEEGAKVSNTFAKVAEYLQHAISRNKEILNNQPMIPSWNSENSRVDLLFNVDSAIKYTNILSIATPTDMFAFPVSKLLGYDITNISKENSKLIMYNSLFTSENDTCNFTNQNSIILVGKLIGETGVILTKRSSIDSTFNFKIESVSNDLVITISSVTGSLTYTVHIDTWGYLYNENHIHTITFDGSVIKYYCDGEEIVGTLNNNSFTEPLNMDGMILSNSLLNGIGYNGIHQISDIIFYNKCLSADEIKKTGKVINYLL